MLRYIKSSILKFKFVFLILLVLLSVLTAYLFLHSYLKQITEQFSNDFYAQNSIIMERGDSYELVYRLTALSSSMHWVCVQAIKNDVVIFHKNRSSDCNSGLFQKVKTIHAQGNSELQVRFTFELPTTLKAILLLYILLQVFFLSLIGWVKIREEKDKLKISLDWQNRINSIVAQVVHDIKSPLAALKLAIRNRNMTSVLESATSRIESILDDLTQDDKSEKNNLRTYLKNECDLIIVLNEIIEEKEVSLKKENKSLTLNFLNKELYQEFVISLNHQNCARILSNLINNAIEAFDGYQTSNPRIDFNLKIENIRNQKVGVFEITDNGKGIKSEQLIILQSLGGTFGKLDGKGLGLKHANEHLKAVGGSVKIQSVVRAEGENNTVVTLHIPLVYEVLKHKGQKLKIVLIDDDKFVHGYWKIASQMAQVQLSTYKTYKEFTEFNHDKDIPIFLDKNLGEGVSGYDLAEVLYKRDGYQKIYLVTGEDVKSETLPLYFENSIPRKEFPTELIATLKNSYSKTFEASPDSFLQ